MSNPILMLRLEHRTIAQLLDVLETEIDLLANGELADTILVGQIAAYLGEFPGRCHHPKEDVVYRRLHARLPGAAASIGDLVGEHDELARRVAGFADLVAPAAGGSGNAVHALVVAGRELLDIYRRHMLREERHFFPAALRLLTVDDWEAIDFSLFDGPDPVYDHDAEQRFGRLREHIEASIEARDESRARRAEARWLYRLNRLEDFNAAMSAGTLRLERTGDGGFVLVDGERPLVSIPESDESRAAWCAYYFLKGHRQGQFGEAAADPRPLDEGTGTAGATPRG